MKRTYYDLADVYESAAKLMVPLTPEETYSVIVKEAQRLANSVYGSIFLMREDELVRVYSSVPVNQQLVPRKQGYTYQSFYKQKTMVVPVEKIKKGHPEFEGENTSKMIFIPLCFEAESLGVITLDSSDTGVISKDKLKVLELFGSLASLKIRTNVLFSEVTEALRTRDLFISMASHELKTPLTTISAYAQLIERNLLSEKPIKVEWVSNLKTASGRMTRLINELLHINQIRSGKMMYQFEEVDPMEIITLAVTDFGMSFPEHKVIVTDERKKTSQKIIADRDKLIQVVVNTLNNAGKFTDVAKEISITLSESQNKLFVKILDQGKGIPKEDLIKIFDEFFKATNNNQEGLGLGLFISKKIIEAHHGKITIKSKVGVGTTILLELPLS